METDKACGPNSIPISILKTFKKELSKPLSDIINLSFSTGAFPETMKTPVFKKDYKLDCNNYRPISLLTEKTSHRQTFFTFGMEFSIFLR